MRFFVYNIFSAAKYQNANGKKGMSLRDNLITKDYVNMYFSFDIEFEAVVCGIK